VGDRLLDIPAYLVVARFIETAALVCFWLVALVRVPSHGWRDYRRLVGRSLVFGSVFLVAGCIDNSVFMLVAYERMYVSRDTVVDFFPFIPFGQWVLDSEFAGRRGQLLNGASLRQIQLLWAAIAAPVWCSTIWFYRGYVREQADIGH
jgi:hypothetical protein